MHTPEGRYDELIDRLRETGETLPARCEELAQRCNALAAEMREENARSKRNARIPLIMIAVATAALLTVTVASVASNPYDNRSTPGEREPGK